MFIGEYSQQIGEKYRIAIPKRIRIELQNEIILTKGFDKSLMIIDKKRWKRIIEEIDTKKLFNRTTRMLKQYFLGSALEIEPDNQGRFVIPEFHRAHAELTDIGVFIGVGNWVELWSRDNYEAHKNTVTSNLEDTIFDLYDKHNE